MDNFLSYTMDLVYENSVPAIESLQTRFHQQSSMFFMISNIFDPRYAFLFYSPLIFSLDWKIGKKIMWVSVIAEWSNQVLKWVLHGERPYWWIRETQVYNKTGTDAPELRQYFLTCETGPGSPSGHSMVTAAVFYIIIDSFLRKTGAVKKNSINLLQKGLWTSYLILLMVVGTSRVYIAAHFPHQCFLGVTLGCLLAMAMDNIKTDSMKTRHYVYMTVGLLGSALSTFFILLAAGINPLWSIDRAVKWCAKQEYIHLDTTPFFSMMRYCGFMFGMGFGFNSKSFRHLSAKNFTVFMKIVAAILSVGMTKLSEKIDLPGKEGTMIVFYTLAFLLNALLPYIMIAVIPNLVFKMFSQKAKSQ